LDEPVIPVDPVPLLFIPLLPEPLELADPLEPFEPLAASDEADPLDAPDDVVLGSTLLPVPRVAELMPEPPGVELCATAIPAEQNKAAKNAADTCFFMTTPEKKINLVGSQRTCHAGFRSFWPCKQRITRHEPSHFCKSCTGQDDFS
jgi:hypothetical protein